MMKNALRSRPARAGRCDVRASASVKVPQTSLKRVQLGDSDLMGTTCCLGTMTWGVQNTEAEAHEQLSYAIDAGVNFIDTAEAYPIPMTKETQGRTDQYISTWLKDQKRQDLVLATKVCGYSERNTYLRSKTLRVTPDQIESSVNESLKRLGTDYIDLLQVHWPDRYVPLFGQTGYDVKLERESVPFEEQLKGLEAVVKAGKVRYVGVSNETSYGVAEFTRIAKEANLPKISTIQNVYHMLSRTAYETDLAETCHRHNVSLLAYSPLAGGSLSGKYNHGEHPKSRFNLFPGYMERYNKSVVKVAVSEYEAVATKYGLTPTQLALAWVKSRWFVTSTIIGATTMQQLKENIEAFSVELSDEAVAEVNAIYKKYRDPSLM